MAPEVTDNVAQSRYEYVADGAMSFIEYRRSPGVIVLTYAKVPPHLEGRGLGARMVRAVLDAIRIRGEKVVPQCSFVAAFIRRHPEYQDMVAASG
jgi:hypothetical protein